MANELGITARTVRLYEELGLIGPSARTDKGIRLYGEECIDQLTFILKLKESGLTLLEIQEIVHAIESCTTTRENITKGVELIDVQLKSIGKKKSALKALEKEIVEYRQKIIGHCFLFRSPESVTGFSS